MKLLESHLQATNQWESCPLLSLWMISSIADAHQIPGSVQQTARLQATKLSTESLSRQPARSGQNGMVENAGRGKMCAAPDEKLKSSLTPERDRLVKPSMAAPGQRNAAGHRHQRERVVAVLLGGKSSVHRGGGHVPGVSRISTLNFRPLLNLGLGSSKTQLESAALCRNIRGSNLTPARRMASGYYRLSTGSMPGIGPSSITFFRKASRAGLWPRKTPPWEIQTKLSGGC